MPTAALAAACALAAAPAAAAADPPLLYLRDEPASVVHDGVGGGTLRQAPIRPNARWPAARTVGKVSGSELAGDGPRRIAAKLRAGWNQPAVGGLVAVDEITPRHWTPDLRPGPGLGAGPAGPAREPGRLLRRPGAGRAGGPRRPAPGAAGQAAAAGRRHEPRPRHLPPDLPRRPLPAAAARDGDGAHALARALAGRPRRAARPAGPRRRPGPGRAVDAGPLDRRRPRAAGARARRLRPARRRPRRASGWPSTAPSAPRRRCP